MKTKEKSRIMTEKDKILSELTESVCNLLFFSLIYTLTIDKYSRTKIQ